MAEALKGVPPLGEFASQLNALPTEKHPDIINARTSDRAFEWWKSRNPDKELPLPYVYKGIHYAPGSELIAGLLTALDPANFPSMLKYDATYRLGSSIVTNLELTVLEGLDAADKCIATAGKLRDLAKEKLGVQKE